MRRFRSLIVIVLLVLMAATVAKADGTNPINLGFENQTTTTFDLIVNVAGQFQAAEVRLQGIEGEYIYAYPYLPHRISNLAYGTYIVHVILIDGRAMQTQFVYFGSGVTGPPITNPVPNPVQTVVLNEVSDWILATYNGLGLCPGDTSDLYIGDLVAPVERFQGTGVILRPLPQKQPVNNVRTLGKLVWPTQFAKVISGPVCFQNETYRKVALYDDVSGYFYYGWMVEVNSAGSRVLIRNPIAVAPPADFANSVYMQPNLSGINYLAGQAIMFEDQRFTDPRGVSVRTHPGYSECMPGVRIFTRVNITDGIFQIIGRNLTGNWLKIRLVDGREGWIVTRLTITNLNNPNLYATLPAMSEFSSCPSIVSN